MSNAHIADAVPVVRCKDCKHYTIDGDWCEIHSYLIPGEYGTEWNGFLSEDFCSYGERKMTELKTILDKHLLWLKGENGGERANLREAALQGADLRRAALQGANLQGADLQGADLRWATLRGADLREVDLRGASLQGADLRGADLDCSCWPLECGGLDVHLDDRLAIQLLYHLIRCVLYSKNTSKGLKAALSTKELIGWANKFHRDELPRIEVPGKQAKERDTE